MTENVVANDRTTIGVSPQGEEALAILMSRGWFDKEVVAFRVAIAYALAHALEPSGSEVSYTTKWNRGSLEQSDMLADLIQQFHPTDRPYELAQSLGDAGLRAMAERVRNGDGLTSILGEG